MQNLSHLEPERNHSRSPRQLDVLKQGDHSPSPVYGSGVRPDLTWTADGGVAGRPNKELLDGIEWMHSRRGAPMSTSDEKTLWELKRRSFDFRTADACRFRGVPAWVQQLDRKAGFQNFVGIVMAAYRAGAIGVWISYSEAMALTGVRSSSTWRRWTTEMEDLGLIRCVQTWVSDPADQYRRIAGPMLYVAGVALCEEMATLEGAFSNNNSAAARDARISAKNARNRARAADSETLAGLRRMRAPHQDKGRSGAPAWSKRKSPAESIVAREDDMISGDGIRDEKENRQKNEGHASAADLIANHSFNCASINEALSPSYQRGEVTRPLPPSGKGSIRKKGQASRLDHAGHGVPPVRTQAPNRPPAARLNRASTPQPTKRKVTPRPCDTDPQASGGATDRRADAMDSAAVMAALGHRLKEGFKPPVVADDGPTLSIEERRRMAADTLAKQRSAYSTEAIERLAETFSRPLDAPNLEILKGLTDLEVLWLKLGARADEFVRRTGRTLTDAREICRAWAMRQKQ